MDLFKPLSDEDISNLIDKLKENYSDQRVRVLCFSVTMVEFKKKGMNTVDIFAPNGDFSDFTVLICLQIGGFYLATYHSESDVGCDRLKRALGSTSLFDNAEYLLIAGLHDDVHRKVGVEWSRMDLVQHVPCCVFTWSSDEAVAFESSIPYDVDVRNLVESDAQLIDSYWPHRMNGTLDYIKKIIEYCPSVGLYSKSDGRLLSWVVKSQFGALGFLQTVDKARRRGYAGLVVARLSKIFARQSFPIHAAVHLNNPKSYNLFVKMGFTRRFDCHYIKFKKA